MIAKPEAELIKLLASVELARKNTLPVEAPENPGITVTPEELIQGWMFLEESSKGVELTDLNKFG